MKMFIWILVTIKISIIYAAEHRANHSPSAMLLRGLAGQPSWNQTQQDHTTPYKPRQQIDMSCYPISRRVTSYLSNLMFAKLAWPTADDEDIKDLIALKLFEINKVNMKYGLGQNVVDHTIRPNERNENASVNRNEYFLEYKPLARDVEEIESYKVNRKILTWMSVGLRIIAWLQAKRSLTYLAARSFPEAQLFFVVTIIFLGLNEWCQSNQSNKNERFWTMYSKMESGFHVQTQQ